MSKKKPSTSLQNTTALARPLLSSQLPLQSPNTLQPRRIARITKIISGGQSGADLGALLAARRMNIETGGWMPAGFLTEYGKHPEYEQLFNVKQSHSVRYSLRTLMNVRDSDGTLWIGPAGSTGYKATINACRTHYKPGYHILTQAEIPELITWLALKNISILNVAGNRASKNANSEKLTFDIITALLEKLEELEKKQ